MRFKATTRSQVTTRSQATVQSRSQQINPPRQTKRLLRKPARDQELLLDGLNNDVLATIVDFLFGMDELSGVCITVYDNPGPYIRTHRSTLDLSVVNKRLRSVCIPKLFRNIHRWSKTMGQLNRQLKDIEINPSILSSIRTCEIVTSSRGDLTLCSTRLPTALEGMPFLKELSFAHRKKVDLSGTRVTFRYSDVVLPTVTGLRIQCEGPWDFLIDACPNTEILILRDNVLDGATMEAASDLGNLQHLELYEEAWDQECIKMIHDNVPNVQSLALKGGIRECHSVANNTLDAILKWTETFALFPQLKTLAMTIECTIEEWRFEAAFSDDSVVAESIIRSSKENGTDINQRQLAEKYFTECRALETLWFWEVATVPYPWTATRDSKGDVTSVECEYYDDEDFDWEAMSDHMRTLDQDNFPLVLSFDRRITSYDAQYDPPRFGRTPPAERKDYEAREKELSWYRNQWLRLRLRCADSDSD